MRYEDEIRAREMDAEKYRKVESLRLAHGAATHVEKLTASGLCQIYFEIAAECIGEDEVRKRRDARIDKWLVVLAEVGQNLTDAKHKEGSK